MYKDLLCVQNAKTLSLKEIHLSNVLLNYIDMFVYIYCSLDVLLPDMFDSMTNKEKLDFTKGLCTSVIYMLHKTCRLTTISIHGALESVHSGA